MTSLLAIPATFIGSCTGTCASYTLCKVCTSKCELSNEISKYIFLFFMFIGTSIGGLLSILHKPLDIHFDWKFTEQTYHLCGEQCVGDSAIYRTSAALSIFYMIMALCTCTISHFSTTIHKSYWFSKFFILISLIVSFMFIPQSIINAYVNVCQYLSILFLCLQLLTLIDFGYTFNEKLISFNNEGSFWAITIVILSITMNIACMVMMIYLYMTVTTTIGFIIVTVTTLLCLFHTIISLSNVAQHGTLLTSSIVSIYMFYLCFASLHTPLQNGIERYMGIFFTAGSLCFSAHSASLTNIFHIEKTPSINSLHLLNSIIIKQDDILHNKEINNTISNYKPYTDESQEIKEKEEQEEQKQEEYCVNGFFHIMLMLASMYMAMIFTDWGHMFVSSTDSSIQEYNFKIISLLICSILYIWTLIAPSLFPDRDFS